MTNVQNNNQKRLFKTFYYKFQNKLIKTCLMQFFIACFILNQHIQVEFYCVDSLVINSMEKDMLSSFIDNQSLLSMFNAV